LGGHWAAAIDSERTIPATVSQDHTHTQRRDMGTES